MENKDSLYLLLGLGFALMLLTDIMRITMLKSIEVGVIVTHSLSRHSNTTDLSLSPLKHPLE